MEKYSLTWLKNQKIAVKVKSVGEIIEFLSWCEGKSIDLFHPVEPYKKYKQVCLSIEKYETLQMNSYQACYSNIDFYRKKEYEIILLEQIEGIKLKS